MFSYIAIPCEDFPRAFRFYSEITGGKIRENPHVPFPMAYFTGEDDHNIGHLFRLDPFKPSGDGTIVYLNLAKDLNEILTLIEAAGGKVVMPKTLIAPGRGYWALFLDTEGNKLALHSTE